MQYRNVLQKTASLFDDFCQGKTGLFAAPADAEGNVDCQGYYNCFHGNEAMQLCGSGRRFNPATKNCDWKRNVACDVQTTTLAPGLTTTQATTQSSVSPSPSTSSPTDPSEFCSGKVGLYAAPVDMAGNEDCRGYFNCFHGDEPMQLCVPGQRFNSDLKNCDWRANVECVTAPTTGGITTTATESSSSTTVSTTMGTTSTSVVEATSTTLANNAARRQHKWQDFRGILCKLVSMVAGPVQVHAVQHCSRQDNASQLCLRHDPQQYLQDPSL